MLELRPICENCGKDMAPSSLESMICSFECTFCRTCVETVLENVCPNCGGGFCSSTDKAGHKLERRQLPWRISRDHKHSISTRGSKGAPRIRGKAQTGRP